MSNLIKQQYTVNGKFGLISLSIFADVSVRKREKPSTVHPYTGNPPIVPLLKANNEITITYPVVIQGVSVNRAILQNSFFPGRATLGRRKPL
jgi:hypothetical protein